MSETIDTAALRVLRHPTKGHDMSQPRRVQPVRGRPASGWGCSACDDAYALGDMVDDFRLFHFAVHEFGRTLVHEFVGRPQAWLRARRGSRDG